MMTGAPNLIRELRTALGAQYVLTGARQTSRYRKGFRFGNGQVLAVLRPGSLAEQWRALRLCHAAGVIIIMQAANTGLTGGSTPDGDDYDRPIVIINAMRIATLHVLPGAEQVVALPGVTLFQLEKTLRPLGREPHSVIGSSCIGASVTGGIANNSGGALIRRGPAFTQLALYARVNEQNEVELVNHLGLRLGNDPETILARLEAGDFAAAEIEHPQGRAASDPDYATHVRDISAPTPARFNADPRRLSEASGSAGKMMIFAVRLDTFPADKTTAVFYIGSNQAGELTAIRRHILAHFQNLPVAGEYIHRTAFDIAVTYGKDMFLAIEKLGTGRLPALFALKGRFDALASRIPLLPRGLSDRLMQFASAFFPQHLPARMLDYRDRYEHHLLLKMSGAGIEEARAYCAAFSPQTRALISSARSRREQKRSCTASPWLVPPSATAPCIPARWRISWRWTLRCAATTRNGKSICPLRCPRQSCTSSITGISSAMCSTRIISWPRGMTRSRWSTACGICSMPAAPNIRPSIMSGICTRPSRLWRRITRRWTRATASTRASARPPNSPAGARQPLK